jgi:hypothetical protein
MTLRIHDNGTDRDMTDEEIAEYETWQKLRQEETKAETEAQIVKATARQALLEKLGITEEEAQLLLGGI